MTVCTLMNYIAISGKLIFAFWVKINMNVATVHLYSYIALNVAQMKTISRGTNRGKT